MNIFAMELAILGCAILNCLRGAVFLGTDNWMENCAVVLNLLLVVTLATQVSSPKSRYDGGEFTVLFPAGATRVQVAEAPTTAETGLRIISARRYLATTPDGSAFMITIGRYDTRRLEGAAARLDHGLNLAIDKMLVSSGARLIKSDFSNAHLDMLSARQANGTIQIPASSSVQRFSIRIAVNQNKMYLLSAIGNERALQRRDAESFFDSFHLE